MKKIVLVSILVISLIIGLSTVVKAEDVIDIEDFGTIEEVPSDKQEETTKPEQTTPENTDGTESNKDNPQTGVKEEAPIIITILGVGVAIYAGIKSKKYNY